MTGRAAPWPFAPARPSGSERAPGVARPAHAPPPRGRARPDPLGGRARRSLLLPVVALLLGALGLFAAAPAQAQTAIKLVSNTGVTGSATGSNMNADVAQAFTTGSNAQGYKLTAVDFIIRQLSATSTPTYTVKVHSNSSGAPGTSLGTLTNPSNLPSNVNQLARFSASGGGIDLTADTTYVVSRISRIEGLRFFSH